MTRIAGTFCRLNRCGSGDAWRSVLMQVQDMHGRHGSVARAHNMLLLVRSGWAPRFRDGEWLAELPGEEPPVPTVPDDLLEPSLGDYLYQKYFGELHARPSIPNPTHPTNR